MRGGGTRWAAVTLALMASSASAHQGDPELAPRARDPGSGQGSSRGTGQGSGRGAGDPRATPEPGDDTPGPLPLLPRVPMAPAAGWFLPPEPTPSDREEEAEANLDAYFEGQLLQERHELGDVHPWYRALGRAMLREFRPNRDDVERERRAGMTPLQQLRDELRRLTLPPERPQDVPGQTLPEQRGAVTDPLDRSQVVEQEAFDHCNPLNAPVLWYRVVLRVTHAPEGELSAVWVHRSSGIRVLDRAALEAVRSGALDVQPPPEAVVGERQAIRSDWAFELGDVAARLGCFTSDGPTAQLSCVEDPERGVMCAILGRGITRTRIRLLRVVDAGHETREERRARRRRDPDRPRP